MVTGTDNDRRSNPDDFMNKFWYALAGVLLLAASASALTLQSSSSQLDVVSNRQSGELTLWFSNPQGESGVYAVNVDAGNLQVAVSPAFGNIEPRSSQAVTLFVEAPDCSRGTFYATVNVDLTTSSGTQRASKTIAVNVRQGMECSGVDVIEGFPVNDVNSNFDRASSIGGSSLSLSNVFDPSEVNVQILAPAGVSNVALGEFRHVKVTLMNRGVSSTFEVRVTVPQREFNAEVSEPRVTLSRNENQDVFVDFRPTEGSGRKWVTLQVLRENVVVAEHSFYVDVANTYSSEFALAEVVSANNCGEKVIRGELRNTGSAADTFTVSLPGLVESQPVSLAARASVPLMLTIDFAQIKEGKHVVEFQVAGTRSSSKKTVEFDVSSCPVSVFNYAVTVTNPTNSTFVGVVATVTGLPTDWEISSPASVDIAPNESKVLIVTVRTHGEWTGEIKPVIVVKDASGRILQSQNLTPIKPSASLFSGFFTLGGFNVSNLQLIAVLILVALAVALFTMRASLERASV